MNCSHCGHHNPDTHRYCGMCGSPLDRAPELHQSPAAEYPVRTSLPTDVDRDPTDPGRVIARTEAITPGHEAAEKFVPEPPSTAYPWPTDPVRQEPSHISSSLNDEWYSSAPDTRVAPPGSDRSEAGDDRYDRDDFEPDNRITRNEFESAETERPSDDAFFDRDDTDFAPPPRNRYLHGPSLLGLAEDSAAADDSIARENATTDYSYLYDDEDAGGRTVNWRLILALAVVVLFGGVLFYLWSQGTNWNSTIVKLTKGDQTPKPQPEIVAKSEPATPGGPEIAVTKNEGPRVGQVGAPAETSQNKAAPPPQQPNSGPSNNNSVTGTSPRPTDANPAGSNTAGAPATPTRPDDARAADAKPVDSKRADTQPADSQRPDARPADPKSEVAKAADAKTAPPVDEPADVSDNAPTSTTGRAAASKPTAARGVREPKKADDDNTAKVRRADALLRAHSCSQAVGLLREAAMQGNATARSRLGGLYATGRCVPLDRAEAYNWFTLAKDAGARYSWIEHNRSMLWAQMDARERERVARR